MSTESGGAAPRRGFDFQDYAAAYFFISDEPTFRIDRPLELHIEEDDTDFSYIIRNTDNEVAHHFEAKEKQNGELKWSKFKNSILPEFASVMAEYPRYSDVSCFHTVTNTAFASKIADLHNDGKSLRSGSETWPILSTRNSRIYNIVGNATGLSDDENALYKLLWGLHGHAISKSEIDTRLTNYLRDCTPRKHRMAKRVILNEIHETDSGILNIDDFEAKIGATLKPVEDTTRGDTTDPVRLRENIEEISQSYTSESNLNRLASDKSSISEYIEHMYEESGVDESVVETHGAQLQEVFDERIELERRKSELNTSISQVTGEILDLDDSTSSEGNTDD